MEPQEVRDVFALVDKVSSLTGRVKDKVAAKGLDEVVESLHALVGPVSANLAAGVLDLSPADVRKLAAGGVLVTPAEPQVDTYGYVHVLGKAKPGRRTAPFFSRDDRLPGWNSALEELAERAGALADKR